MRDANEIAAEIVFQHFPNGVKAGLITNIAAAILSARREARNSAVEDAIVVVGSTSELSLALAGKIAKRLRALAAKAREDK